jgi:hypothetical protein
MNVSLSLCVYLYIDPKSVIAFKCLVINAAVSRSWDQRLGFWILLAAIQLVFCLIYN